MVGGSGGIITRLYNFIRQKSAVPSPIFLKLLGIRVYFSRNRKILELGRGDEIFQFFIKDVNYRKALLLVILFPLVAFIE